MNIDTSSEQHANGLFIHLMVLAICLAVASSVSFGLSFCGGDLANYEGSPSDEAILYSFLYGLVISQAVSIFLPQGSLRCLVGKAWLMTVIRTSPKTAAIWLLVALGGSELSEYFDRGTWEVEWIQISLVLLSCAATFLIWHLHLSRGTCMVVPSSGA